MKKRLCAALAAAALAAGLGQVIYLAPWTWPTLDVQKISAPSQGALVYDRENALIDERGARRVLLQMEDIPDVAAQAFVAIEDARFYSHSGIDLYRIGGALINNLRSGSVREGASTITQQLIKLTHLDSRKTLRRKVQEAWLAICLEQVMDKDEILCAYLNTAYFGAGAYGLEAAAQTYFSHPAKELTLEEAALLAGLVKSPSNDAPHVNYDKALERRNLVLEQMKRCGYIDEETLLKAQRSDIVLDMDSEEGELSGWYADAVIEEACEVLHVTADQLMNGGYRIYTAMNRSMQASADALFEDDTLFPPADSDGTQPQAAMTALDCETGEVLALCGGREYIQQRGFNRATQMKRQPGSAFKPVSVYAAAVDMLGCTGITLLDDTARDYDGYTPSNASGVSHGTVTLRSALVQSMNQATVNLLDRVGIGAARLYAERLGIELSREDSGYALGLGALKYGVSPLRLCAAYAALGNGGLSVQAHTIRRIEDAQGKLLYGFQSEEERVLSEQSAYIISDILCETARSGTARALQDAALTIAAKTGTAGENGGTNRDIWTVAYTPRTALCVWMGYDEPDAHSLAQGITGGGYPARWAAAFVKANRSAFDAPFIQADGLSSVLIDGRSLKADIATPMLASEETPPYYLVRESLPRISIPAQTSYLWDAPRAVGTVYTSEDAHSGMLVSFVAPDSVSLWRVMRRSDSGGDVEIARLEGMAGAYLSVLDEEGTPQDDYYVIARQKYREEEGDIIEAAEPQLAQSGRGTLIERLLTLTQ